MSILKKQKFELDKLEVEIEGQRSTELPRPYEKIHLTFQATGKNLEKQKVEQAIDLSMEKYCGVHGTVAPGVKKGITFNVELKEPQSK